jgi:hypothetical protein
MVINFVYELPFAHSYKGVAGVLLGGGDLNTGGSDIRPDRVADGRLSSEQRSRKRWYDTSAFRHVSCNIPNRPDLCYFGNSGRNILNAPGQRNLDFALFKNFKAGEKAAVQFRSEFFDAFNTPYFGQPNGISFQTVDSVTPDGPRDGEIRGLRSPCASFSLDSRFVFRRLACSIADGF